MYVWNGPAFYFYRVLRGCPGVEIKGLIAADGFPAFQIIQLMGYQDVSCFEPSGCDNKLMGVIDQIDYICPWLQLGYVVIINIRMERPIV